MNMNELKYEYVSYSSRLKKIRIKNISFCELFA